MHDVEQQTQYPKPSMSTKPCRCFPSMHMCVQQYLCPNLLGRKRRKQPNMLMANRNQHGKATHNQPMTQHANNTTNTDFPPSVSHAHRHAPSHMYLRVKQNMPHHATTYKHHGPQASSKATQRHKQSTCQPTATHVQACTPTMPKTQLPSTFCALEIST